MQTLLTRLATRSLLHLEETQHVPENLDAVQDPSRLGRSHDIDKSSICQSQSATPLAPSFFKTIFSLMASCCPGSLFNSRSDLPSFRSKENLIKFNGRSNSQTPSWIIRNSCLCSLTRIRILLLKTHYPRGLRFPVPLDKANEDSGNEIALITRNLINTVQLNTFIFRINAAKGKERVRKFNTNKFSFCCTLPFFLSPGSCFKTAICH